jgi:hypothetical protein
MKRIGLSIGFAAMLAFMLPGLPAQDEKKKDIEKTEKKEIDKKDPEAKDPEKKKKEKEPEPKKDKLVYGDKFASKILGFKGDSNRELTIEVQVRDDKKVQDVANWSAQRQQQLAQQYAQALQQKDLNARANQLANWKRDTGNYQLELAKKNVYSPKSMEVRAHETAKVRAMTPPIEFDDQGFQKKWTKKELEALKDKTGLPGYPVEFDALKSGQYIQVYMAKVAPAAKKKKGADDDDPPPAPKTPEFVLIVITAEAK